MADRKSAGDGHSNRGPGTGTGPGNDSIRTPYDYELSPPHLNGAHNDRRNGPAGSSVVLAVSNDVVLAVSNEHWVRCLCVFLVVVLVIAVFGTLWLAIWRNERLVADGLLGGSRGAGGAV